MGLGSVVAREFWAPVPGYPEYRASTEGRIMGPRKMLKPNQRTFGRPFGDYVSVRLNGHQVYVHQVIARTFLGPQESGVQVRHRNGDPTDNRLCNVEYGTGVDNWSDKREHGRATVGEYQGRAKLTEDAVRIIRMSPSGSDAALADRFGVARITVQQARIRRTWRHIQ